RFKIIDEKGFAIVCRAWEKEGAAPTAILQIVHGMAEHGGRYGGLAEFLLERGIFTFASDHRGHGLTATENGTMGYFADEKGWEKVVDDIGLVNRSIREAYPGVPVFILGHSMGSFIARDYMHANESSGVILSGSAYKSGWELFPAKLLADAQKVFLGKRNPGRLMDKLSFGSFNDSFSPNRTSFDWLSRDDSEVDKYVEDPMCGYVCTVGFFGDLLEGLIKINSRSHIDSGMKKTPVFFLSGEKDPVGRNGEDIEKLFGFYKGFGYEDVSKKLIKGARHEILNETNRVETRALIYEWIKERS
ncbi:MAG: alpha/beta hydrolase, partial [Clostridiales bacterium]